MRADLHIHSSHSEDGRMKVEEIIERCIALNIQAVSITDHNTLKGSKEAIDLRNDKCLIVPGMEITTETGGHLLAYNVQEEIPRGLPIQETIDRIHQQGGIAVVPHPYRLWSGMGEKLTREFKFDGLEVLNSRSLRRSNRRAENLSRSLGIGMTGGSDAHDLRNLGGSCTILPDDCRTADDIAKAILRCQTSTEGRDRSIIESLSYGSKSIGRWFLRGFRRL